MFPCEKAAGVSICVVFRNMAIVVKPAEQDLWKDIGVDDMSDDLGNPNNLIV